ncbi:hypothetical protein JX266_014521 [Neoarthrinium moseri]|nr:hypothetical protein JX266_014521 [Neoarthrinium moseri]
MGQVDIESKDNGGRTPLLLSAGKGHAEVVRLLLETEEVEVNTEGNDGQTPLWWAARAGNELVVAKLLSSGANPGVIDLFVFNT